MSIKATFLCNLSIALAIAINAFGERGTDAALVVALAYIIQVQSAAWYVKFTDRIFGRPSRQASLGPRPGRLADTTRQASSG